MKTRRNLHYCMLLCCIRSSTISIAQRSMSSKRTPCVFRAACHLLNNRRYLPSYPYLLSGSLHTYAGMLAFYVAQPASARAPMTTTQQLKRDTTESVSSERSSSLSSSHSSRETPNAGLMRQARGWFAKAQEIDSNDEVAEEFTRIVSGSLTAR